MKPILALILLLSVSTTLKADPDMIRSNDLLLTGTISTYPILLQLGGDTEPLDWRGDSQAVRGSYWYNNVLTPIDLEGHVCPKRGTFLFYHDKGGPKEECFEGTLKEGITNWEGKWKQGEKQLKLKLQLAKVALGPEVVKRFMEFVKWDMAGEGEEPPMEDAIVRDAGVDATGKAYIKGFQPGWNGDITFFSPTRLSYYTDYNSTARSTTFAFTLQALADGKHFLELGTWMNYDKTEDKSDFGYEVGVWKWENGEFVHVQVLPEGVEAYNSGEGSSYEDGQMDAEVGLDRMKLRMGEKSVFLILEDGKFVKQSYR